MRCLVFDSLQKRIARDLNLLVTLQRFLLSYDTSATSSENPWSYLHCMGGHSTLGGVEFSTATKVNFPRWLGISDIRFTEGPEVNEKLTKRATTMIIGERYKNSCWRLVGNNLIY